MTLLVTSQSQLSSRCVYVQYTIGLWSTSFTHYIISCAINSLFLPQSELDHDNEVSCIDLDCDALRVASGTVDGRHCSRASFRLFKISLCPVILQGT